MAKVLGGSVLFVESCMCEAVCEWVSVHVHVSEVVRVDMCVRERVESGCQ